MPPSAIANPHKHPGRKPEDDPGDEGDGLELPVNPDEGTPLIPDNDGEATVPA